MKKEKGVTIVILIVTIVVILIVTSTIILEMTDSDNLQDYNSMCSDIERLTDSIALYYNKYAELPLTLDEVVEINGENYKIIDLQKLNNITLNFGRGTLSDGDIYLYNLSTGEVYYKNGIVANNTVYYSKRITGELATPTCPPHIDQDYNGYCDNCGAYISNNYEYVEE